MFLRLGFKLSDLPIPSKGLPCLLSGFRVLRDKSCCCRGIPSIVLRREISFNFVRTYAQYSGGDSGGPQLKGDNVILMGSPGAGKTTVGRIVASCLGKDVIDIDDDHLEKVWGITVAEKLSLVGSDGFLEEEGNALLQFSASDAVVSLSGSNPMHQKAMQYTSTLGTVIYLDVDDGDILSRLAAMKVNRIVGQNEGTSMQEILKYRKQFYEESYDIRIICEKGDSAEEIANKVLQSLHRKQMNTGFTSTRQEKSQPNSERAPGFLDVVLEGLAPDGGLYVPRNPIPYFNKGQWERLVDCTYQERALHILEAWLSPSDLPPTVLNSMISKAYSANFQHPDIAPLVKFDNKLFMQELFHGPTASFKDLALQLTPQFFNEAILKRSKSDVTASCKLLILVATSGDTGSAVLEGFKHYPSIGVLVFYPENGVSLIQKTQMTCVSGSNISVVGVESDFDFCQTAIKRIFNNLSFANKLTSSSGVVLSAANSINWGRLLPQVVYHASAYLDLVKSGVISMGEMADLCIPTGNFGNILAAYYAREMGIPFKNLICASNENNILTEFFQSGCYDMRNRHLYQTISPSIDILKSSNLERLLYHVTDNCSKDVSAFMKSLEENRFFQVSDELKQAMSSVFQADWSPKERCLATIRSMYDQRGYLVDTHTAVAKDVADRFANPHRPMIVSATAHYSKFAYEVLTGLGKQPTTDDPVELFNSLHQLQCVPYLHDNLKKIVRQPVVHRRVCKANTDLLMEAVEMFVQQ